MYLFVAGNHSSAMTDDAKTVGLLVAGPSSPLKGYFAELNAIKSMYNEMVARGVPPEAAMGFINAYGAANFDAVFASQTFMKIGFSNSQLTTLATKFDAKTISILENTFAKIQIVISGRDIDVALTFFKQAGTHAVAEAKSYAVITLTNVWGIAPKQYSDLGIHNLRVMDAVIDALNADIAADTIQRLVEVGVRATQYNSRGITDNETALSARDAMANAIANGIDESTVITMILIPSRGASGLMQGHNIPGGFRHWI